jgi:hypothetical protein
MIGRHGQREADGPALVVDHVADPDGCQEVIAALMGEYERYVESEHAICPACPVVRTGPLIVRSMLQLEGCRSRRATGALDRPGHPRIPARPPSAGGRRRSWAVARRAGLRQGSCVLHLRPRHARRRQRRCSDRRYRRRARWDLLGQQRPRRCDTGRARRPTTPGPAVPRATGTRVPNPAPRSPARRPAPAGGRRARGVRSAGPRKQRAGETAAE